MINDADLVWNGDLRASPTGDILLSAGGILSQQRVLRRLLTNTADYIWHTGYGAGLGEFVGSVTNQRQIVGTLRRQLFEEATVSQSPQPSVEVAVFGDGSVYVDLRYADAATAGTQYLTFTVGN